MGKTTISAVLARTLARGGRRVIALDCDTDPNLAINTGVGGAAADGMRPFLDQSGEERVLSSGMAPTEVVALHGLAGPDDVTLLVAARSEKAGSGCIGMGQAVARDLIADVAKELGDVFLVADMEAGLEHLSKAGGVLRDADALLVVIQPQEKVLVTARRIVALADQLGIPRVVLVANRVRPGGEDEAWMHRFAAENARVLLAMIPEDEALAQADRIGVSPLDACPDSPAVTAIVAFADRLVEFLYSPAEQPAN